LRIYFIGYFLNKIYHESQKTNTEYSNHKQNTEYPNHKQNTEYPNHKQNTEYPNHKQSTEYLNQCRNNKIQQHEPHLKGVVSSGVPDGPCSTSDTRQVGELVPIRMPIVCWKTRPQNLTNMLSV